MKAKISVVTTLYYSSPYIHEFYERTVAVARQLVGEAYEIVLVNDGSPDDSVKQARLLVDKDSRVVVVNLSRNFGHHKAAMTGLRYATGELVFLTDVDLEEPPEILAAFYEKMKQTGADVVYGVMAKRQGSLFRQLSGRTFYWLLKKLSGMDIPPNLLMARLMTHQYVEHLVAHDEHVFSIEGLWYLTGYEQVPITVEKLYKGSTTYTLNKRIALAVKSITAVSNQPLLYITYLGLFITVPSGLYIVLLLAQYATGYISNVSGWASLIISVWFLGGLIIFILGIISIYLSIIFVETKNRPYTLVRDVFRQTPDETQDTSSQRTQL